MRKALLTIHKWAGLGLFVLLFLQASTGILLTNKAALWRAFAPDVSRIDATKPLDLEGVLSNLKAEFPRAYLERVTFDAANPNFLIARVYKSKTSATIAVVDGATAEILSSGPVRAYPLELAERIHVSLLAGDTGHIILAVEGLFLVIMSVSGLIIWWPRHGRWASAFKIRFRAPAPLLMRDLHTLPAVFAAPFFIATGLTGVAMVAEPLVRPLVAVFAPVSPELQLSLPKVEKPADPVSAEAAFQTLRERFPEDKIRQLRFPAGERIFGAVMVDTKLANPRAHDLAGVDRWTGDLVVFSAAQSRPGGDVFMEWLLPIHTGEIWRGARFPIQTTVGLALAAITLTGPLIWLIRRNRRRKSAR